MYLITLLAQLISNLRAKYTVLRLRQFFSPSTYPINSIFTVAVRIYKIYVFNEVYFLSEATVATITKSVFFSLFSSQPSLGHIFYHNHAAYQSKLALKMQQ